jgi:hypothetical protein
MAIVLARVPEGCPSGLGCVTMLHGREPKAAASRCRLAGRFSQIDGWRCLSLTRALGAVKCQLALVWLALRS